VFWDFGGPWPLLLCHLIGPILENRTEYEEGEFRSAGRIGFENEVRETLDTNA
jgi:hypothetical protein